jgi:Mannitol repressor
MDEFAQFLEEFQRETDRAAAVLGAAYLDNRLDLLLRSKFVAVPKFVDDLLTGLGGPSSFSARIRIAYAIGLISRRAADDLHSIRRIRNDFAHRPNGLSFETPQIESRVANFNILRAPRDESGTLMELPTEPRRRSNVAVVLLLLAGIDIRTRDLPKFQEATGMEVIKVRPSVVGAQQARPKS